MRFRGQRSGGEQDRSRGQKQPSVSNSEWQLMDAVTELYGPIQRARGFDPKKNIELEPAEKFRARQELAEKVNNDPKTATNIFGLIVKGWVDTDVIGMPAYRPFSLRTVQESTLAEESKTTIGHVLFNSLSLRPDIVVAHLGGTKVILEPLSQEQLRMVNNRVDRFPLIASICYASETVSMAVVEDGALLRASPHVPVEIVPHSVAMLKVVNEHADVLEARLGGQRVGDIIVDQYALFRHGSDSVTVPPPGKDTQESRAAVIEVHEILTDLEYRGVRRR